MHALLAPNFIVIKFNRLLCGISSSQKISGITLIFREPCVFAHAPGSVEMFRKLVRGWSSGTLAARLRCSSNSFGNRWSVTLPALLSL